MITHGFKKIALVVASAIGFCAWQQAKAEDNLTYQFNDRVAITILNVPCKIKQLDKLYEFAVVAKRVDGQYLFGCFTHKNDDIVIQW
jgi:hypothetical protein